MKKLIRKYLKLINKIDERHYWPLFIFLSLYFVIPYSEFVITALIIWYFKGGEKLLRRCYDAVTKRLPQWITVGSSVIFFLVMLDDTLMYLTVIGIAYWSNRQAKKLKEKSEDGL
tara:strand:+ start:425 stop:769 length:345 start_codon:yes stop_codon:yes gene_type:complete